MLPFQGVLSIGRFRGVLPVAVLIFLFLLAANFLLLGMTGFAPSGRVDRTPPVPWSELEDAEHQAVGLSAFYEHNPAERQKAFLMYMGMSSAREGVDPAVLRRNACGWRVTGICAAGGDTEHLFEMARPFLRRNFRPTVVLLCLHAFFLVASPLDVPSGSVNPVESLQRHNWRQARERLSWWNWFSSNYTYMNHLAFAGLEEARENVGAIGPVDPWADLTRYGLPQHQSAAYLKTQLEHFAGHGWLDPVAYQTNGERGMEWLARTVSGFRNRGAEVIVVTMPEASAMKTHVPPIAQRMLVDFLKRQYPTNTPPLLDFRYAIPDTMFTDLVHLNDAGRKVFSERLARDLRPLLSAAGCGIK
jgi:hypothetical protein